MGLVPRRGNIYVDHTIAQPSVMLHQIRAEKTRAAGNENVRHTMVRVI